MSPLFQVKCLLNFSKSIYFKFSIVFLVVFLAVVKNPIWSLLGLNYTSIQKVKCSSSYLTEADFSVTNVLIHYSLLGYLETTSSVIHVPLPAQHHNPSPKVTAFVLVVKTHCGNQIFLGKYFLILKRAKKEKN